MTTKEHLYRLIDAIPERELAAAEKALAPLVDPVLRAFLEAPEDDEPLTEEDIAAIEEGKADMELIPWEVYRAERENRA